MTRTSFPHALLFAVVAAITVVATVLVSGALSRGGAPPAEAGTPTEFEMYLDCDVSDVAIDDDCTYLSGTPNIDIGAVLKNNSGLSIILGSFNMRMNNPNSARFSPPVGASCGAPAFGCNPNFNGDPINDPTDVLIAPDLTGAGWSCTPPTPDNDTGLLGAGQTQSFISCSNGLGDGPTMNDTDTLLLAAVRYNVLSDGPGSFAIAGVNVFDDSITELISCNPVVTTAGNCFGADVLIQPPPTITDTPTPSETPTVTNTPLPTDTPTITPTPGIPDTDGDGLNDNQELLLGTNPNVADTDADGLTDGEEVLTHLTDPLDPDTDDDGLTDGDEVDTTNTNPRVADSDGDGLNDGHEVNVSNTDPNDTDSDDDGINDGPEVLTFMTDPNNPDSDADGLNDLQEIVIGSDPNDDDTDNDGLTDGAEVITHGTSPLLQDTDGDLLTDGDEINTYLTDPTIADTDSDGLSDGYEVNTSLTLPNDSDTDNDGASDGAEVNIYGSNPLVVDTDGDTMPDGFEIVNLCLLVLVPDGAGDPDLDLVGNLAELGQLTLPCDPDTDNDGFRDKIGTSQAHFNISPIEDNCILIFNPTQENNDGDFINLPPPILLFDDLTSPSSDAIGDPCDPDDDNDGLTDVAETGGPPCASASGATDPIKSDTDGDRTIDGFECGSGTNPNNAASVPTTTPATDPDNDGLTTLVEGILGTLPNDNDTDNDLIKDGAEVRSYASNPLSTNSDGDDCPDNKEAAGLNNDRDVNSGDQLLLASFLVSLSYIVEIDINRDGALNSGDQVFLATVFGPC